MTRLTFLKWSIFSKKGIFLENGWSDRAQNWCVDARDDFGKMNFEKGGGVHKTFIFQRKLPRPSPQREEKQCKVETFWCEINILKESTLENYTSLDYKSELQKSRSLRENGQFLKQLFDTFS